MILDGKGKARSEGKATLKNRARLAGNGAKMGREPRGTLEGLGANFLPKAKNFCSQTLLRAPRFPTHFDTISRFAGTIFLHTLHYKP